MKRIQNYLTQNPCYQQGKPLIPSCIQIHSIGIPQPRAERIMENWNRPEANAMVHAILEANGTVYEIMEYNKCPWADKGYANRHAIAFEMTEPDTIRSAIQKVQSGKNGKMEVIPKLMSLGHIELL